MPEFLDSPTIRVAFALAVLCVLCAIAFYVVSIFRDYADDDQEANNDLLANLAEMRLKGEISDEEFRKIEAANRPSELEVDDERVSSSQDVEQN